MDIDGDLGLRPRLTGGEFGSLGDFKGFFARGLANDGWVTKVDELGFSSESSESSSRVLLSRRRLRLVDEFVS